MERRLSEIEGKLEALTESHRQLTERVAALESERARSSEPWVAGEPQPEQPPPSVEGEPLPTGVPAFQLVSLTGQVFLVLGGAYLLRTLTDSEILPLGVGLGIGFAYALLWVVIGDQCARRNRSLAATFFGATAVMIAYPLTWEATTRFEVLSGGAAAAMIGAVTFATLGLASLRKLPALAWLVTLAALPTCAALVLSTHIVEPHVVVLLLLGVACVWIAYGREWSELAWPTAIGADLAVLFAVTLVAREGGPPESYPDVMVMPVLVLALALPFVYIASFAVQTLLRKKDVHAFEMIQSGAALIVGLGGATYIERTLGYGTVWLGGSTLVLGALSYGVAFLFTGMRWKHRANFLYYGWLALVLTVSGCRLVSGGFSEPILWCALIVAAAFLGNAFRRLTLHYHSAVYLVVAAATGGLVADATRAFLSSSGPPGSLPTFGSFAACGAALVAYVVMSLSRGDPGRVWGTRLPRLATAAVTVLGGATIVVLAIWPHLKVVDEATDPAFLALTRSAALAAFALVLTIIAHGGRLPELRWVLYPLIAFSGIKLVLEDLAVGRALTLFPAFGLYGITLILAARTVRKVQDESTARETPEPA